VVFYGFNPDPDVEEAFEWESTEGVLNIRDIDDDRALIEMDLVMEPSGSDADGVLRVNVSGTVELRH
jgi:hypothetical protein